MEHKLVDLPLNRPLIPLLLLCSLAACCAQNTYYVKPSAELHCPAEPCHTLMEYVEGAERYFTNNTTMIFLFGDHTLQADIHIAEVTDFTMLGDSSTLPDIRSRIVCTKPATVVFDNVSHIQVTFISFISCGKNIRVTIPQIAEPLLRLIYGSLPGSLNASIIAKEGNVTFSYTRLVNSSGTGLIAHKSVVTLNGSCVFFRNKGGGIIANTSVLYLIGKQHFTEGNTFNRVGIYTLPNGSNGFMDNSARYGGGILSFFSTLKCSGTNIFMNNVAARYGGGIHPSNSTLDISGNISFVGNTAHRWGGGVSVSDSRLSICGVSTFKDNVGTTFGGAIVAVRSSVGFNMCSSENSNFTENRNNNYFVNNSARYGGAIDLFVSVLTIESNTNSTFLDNRADLEGGALYVDNSTIYLQANNVIYVRNNSAQLGGAIYVRENGLGGLSYCFRVLNNCFFQPTDEDIFNNSNTPLRFEDNYATLSGANLYGGFIDTCRIPTLPSQYNESGRVFDQLTAITEQQNSTNSITSDPFYICSCENDLPACDRATSRICNGDDSTCENYILEFQVFPGERISLMAVAYGQRNGTTPATVRANLFTRRFEPNSERSRLGVFDNAQEIGPLCAELNYTIFSVNALDILNLYPDGPCSNLGNPFNILVRFRRPCPYGFSFFESEGVCICEERLQQYTNSCDISQQTISRSVGDTFWVGLDLETGGIILHPHCPLFYCTSLPVNFTLNHTEMQCSSNRAGLLCGQCPDGLSLSFGNSDCKQCSSNYLALILVFALAGVGLVMFLFVSKLTVAAGTINGLIFYANIVGADRSFFLAESSYSTFLRVFIAWLNLDFGIEACFYDGMDAYARTWLQLVFPLYIWIIVGFLIVTSRYSLRISKWLGNNPVAILATLFLLSYTKLLRTVIVTFSFTYLDYPDGQRTVWLYDGNVPFLRGRHVLLFLAGLLIFLFLFLPYTLVLLLGQWLQRYSNWRCLSWASNNKLKVFLDAYYAPYKNKHRYWTGLLLLVRFALLLVSASNAFSNPQITLVAVIVCVLLLESWAWLAGGIYKKWFLNALEASFILNLGIIAAGINTSGSQVHRDVLIQTLVTVVLLTFIGIVVFHIYQQINIETVQSWKKTLKQKLNKPLIRRNTGKSVKEVSVSTTIVELREPFLEDS